MNINASKIKLTLAGSRGTSDGPKNPREELLDQGGRTRDRQLWRSSRHPWRRHLHFPGFDSSSKIKLDLSSL